MFVSLDFDKNIIINFLNDGLYLYAGNQEGIKEVEDHEVNEASNENTRILTARDKLAPLKISSINHRFIKDINGALYDIDLIKRKKDEIILTLPNDENRELLLYYKLLSFDYKILTYESLTNMYHTLRELESSYKNGKLAEYVGLQILCMDNEYAELFMEYVALVNYAGDILLKILIAEMKNCKRYNLEQIRKLCRDAIKSIKSANNLIEGEVTHKFCLFIHFFEDSSGNNDIKFYYIGRNNNGKAKVVPSTAFNPNFKFAFLGIPFVMLFNKSIYLTSIKTYMSNTLRYIEEYKLIEEMGRLFLSDREKTQIIKNYEIVTQENDTMKQTIATREQTIAAHEQTIAARDQTIAAHEQTITTMEQTIVTITQENTTMKQTIATLTQKNATMEQTITAQEQVITKHEQTITNHEQKINALMLEISKLRALIIIPPSSENVEEISNS